MDKKSVQEIVNAFIKCSGKCVNCKARELSVYCVDENFLETFSYCTLLRAYKAKLIELIEQSLA